MLEALLLVYLQSSGVILEEVKKARPSEEMLEIYRLRWKPSLKDALAAAKEDSRPIFLVATQQLEDAGNLYKGHC